MQFRYWGANNCGYKCIVRYTVQTKTYSKLFVLVTRSTGYSLLYIKILCKKILYIEKLHFHNLLSVSLFKYYLIMLFNQFKCHFICFICNDGNFCVPSSHASIQLYCCAQTKTIRGKLNRQKIHYLAFKIDQRIFRTK